ncbi:3'(2'),5'-bisphosphate nucleotidase CysQ [Nesterenkonia ebinurensis]|uniref:3'(2'),5'-bisphosphate nucleotidase CysQ n=1 Tax=Nesterenkonia ebinurensis TaxID=2608252 RepID=UPI001CC3B338|nr:3'(2'),5'-bisphosphate nucleotidase CysQ [Nesterenkonia ebinurensis]
MSLIDEETQEHLVAGVHEAGRKVLEIYTQDFAVMFKGDESPLTVADTAAHHALTAVVREAIPHVPVLSEESADMPWEVRRTWSRYWLIDPLDGTKEFIKKNGEFTLNVALVENGVPVFGIVHAPVLERTWVGDSERGAWRTHGTMVSTPLAVRPLPVPGSEPWKIVGSRSHGSREFETFVAQLPGHERVSMGSSIKLCLVAEGNADLYPRLAPTSEWDTAAAQAVVTAAGGVVLDAHTLQPLRCNQKESVLNPFFIVAGQRDRVWEDALASTLSSTPENR